LRNPYLLNPSSDPAGEKQYQKDHHYQAQSSARVIAPGSAVRPRGQSSQQQHDQNHEKN
jgi:hypothetical protein